MSFPYRRGLTEKARALRKNATPQENRLWYQFLRKYPLRFTRQKPIGSYIVDFYCRKANLVIELDGGRHFEDGSREYDAERDSFLSRAGLRVLRFTNLQINRNFPEVCEEIDRIARERAGRDASTPEENGPGSALDET